MECVAALRLKDQYRVVPACKSVDFVLHEIKIRQEKRC